MRKFILLINMFVMVLSLSACGSGESNTPLRFYTLGGSVSGLTNGSKIVLENNGTSPLIINSNGTFVFRTLLVYNSSYLVTVAKNPVGQTCTVSNDKGSAVTANVTNVEVLCGGGGGDDTVFHSFSGSDGTYPSASLIEGGDGNLYGTTQGGGEYGNGTVFKIEFSGKETLLHSFGAGSDGTIADAGLVEDSNGDFYGTTSRGGEYGSGTVFKITSSGDETVLHSFDAPTSSDGQYPQASLIIGGDGNFYGTTFLGGEYGDGTVFKITNSGHESVVYSFGRSGDFDGANPYASLIIDSSGNFYGTTEFGGESGDGTVFKITSSGDETVLHSFGGPTSSDGENPYASLIIGGDGNFYGTTFAGGEFGNGTVFKIEASGEETVRYSFGNSGSSDGANPYASLIIGGDGNFYGTTSLGGANGYGTVFMIETSGEESVLYSFGAASDGKYPQASLIIGGDGNFYGTTHNGGAGGYGTVFKFSP